MTDSSTIKVIDSWSVINQDIIVDLQHSFEGLPGQTLIKSDSTGYIWRIKKRVLFTHIREQQKLFVNESFSYCQMNFQNTETQLASANDILKKEKENIFQYYIEGCDHSLKPHAGDTLSLVEKQKFACPCCGYRTYDQLPNGSYAICPVCFWEDDLHQLQNPRYESGANPISLEQAQKNFIEFGACDQNMKKNVRPPLPDEGKDKDWKPF